MDLQIKSQVKDSTQPTASKADQVEIIYYTDPLCCWSWAMEPQWRKLQYEYAGKISWQYIMGGLLPNWKSFNDEVNSINRPIQMGPVWMQASHMSGMPIPDRIWMLDPPASSYPACIAVKCAQLQSARAGERYLRLVREAIMIHQRNISKENVLIDIAEALATDPFYRFDVVKFKEDMKNDNGLEAFRSDLQQVQTRNINRFPTFIFRPTNTQALIMTGFRPYTALVDALKQLAPSIEPTQHVTDAEVYKNYWSSITDKEIEEAVKR